MAREHLEARGRWQSEAAARGRTPEDVYHTIMQTHLRDNIAYKASKNPTSLKGIYGRRYGTNKPHGIQPEYEIRSRDTGKAVYVEIKRQRPQGNAHERLCKYFAPGIVSSAQDIANQDEHIFPFWIIVTNGLANDPNYRQEISHWFTGIESHLLFWKDLYDNDTVIGHFERHIKPLID